MPPSRPRRSPAHLWVAAALSVGLAGCQDGGGERVGEAAGGVDGSRITVATFNVIELSREKVDEVDADGTGTHPQLRAAARVVKSVDPDVLVLNEVDLARAPDGSLDRDDLGRVVRDFADRYLATGPDALVYPHLFVAPSNTGELSGLDLNRDEVVATPDDEGSRAYGDDSWGYGEYPGQYSMAVLSRRPLGADRVRTFRTFAWSDLPDDHLPRDFYGPEVADRLRLSSKSHWDLPVEVDGGSLHLWVSHPTPPVFDGPENRNGRRNFDEIGFWVHYLEGSEALYDDRGREGGYGAGEPFVIAGDLNADPDGGDAVVDGVAAISQLLDHPRIVDPEPHRGRSTADFGDGARVDYLLPSRELTVVDGGVVAPSLTDDPELAAAAREASDHYLVWLEVGLPRER